MRNRFVFIVFVLFFLSFVRGQYYEFTGNSDNGFQQGCVETYDIYFNTQGVDGITVGQPLVILDDEKISYATGSDTDYLRINLFNLYISNNNGFDSWVSSAYPIWQQNYDKIYLNAKNENSVNGYRKYGSFRFTPKYDFTGVDFVFDYDGSNQKTSLAKDGNNVISSSEQNANLTGTILIERKPCLNDITAPNITDKNYSNGDTKVSNIGLDIDFNDDNGYGSVPYVYIDGLLRTGNIWGINNQYGVDSGTVSITVSSNGIDVELNDITDFNWIPLNKTWQYKDRDYNVMVPSNSLFDFEIEKTVNIGYSVKDRVGNIKSKSISFNHPQDPWVSDPYPENGQEFVDLNQPIGFKVGDDWAGVDSSSIYVVLSGLDNDFYNVYLGSDLVLNGVGGSANTDDYNVTLDNGGLPYLSTINVEVFGQDNAGNGGSLASWYFTTRPSCENLGCCFVSLQTGDETTIFNYRNSSLYISGGNDPYFTGLGQNTGYINCNFFDEGLDIYKGCGKQATGTFLGFNDSGILKIDGNNLKAVLSGDTLILSRISNQGGVGGGNVSGGGGDGGGRLRKDNCPDGDNSDSYYDGICGYHSSPDMDICGVNNSKYSDELKGAYLYSYSYGITTMCPIQNADLDGYLYRNQYAKMISEFAINVLGEVPNYGKEGCDDYNDIQDDTQDLQYFMKTACELGLMGLHADGDTPKDGFDPHQIVTRAEFGTVFSRLLFGDKYNVEDESSVYDQELYRFIGHLNALKRFGVMTKIDGEWPYVYEQRGRSMLMLQRADKYGLFYGKIPALNGIEALFE